MRLAGLAAAFVCLFATGWAARAAEPATAGWGDIVATTHVTSRLVAEKAVASPGRAFRVALDQTIIPHWHTYWKNPGDSGLPTKISWTLPPGWTAGPIQWPAPAVFKTGPIVNYGYQDQARLLTAITPPKDAALGESVTLTAQVTWLVCSDICIPERASLPITLSMGPTPGPSDAKAAALFREAAAALPRAPARKIAFSTTGTRSRLDMAMPEAEAARYAGAYFFADDPAVVAAAALQTVSADAAGLHVDLPAPGPLPAGAVKGVLLLAAKGEGGSRRAVVIDAVPGPPLAVPDAASAAAPAAPLVSAPAAPVPAATRAPTPPAATPATPGPQARSAPATAAADLGLLQAVLFALVGGLFLNLMPCVFPVLSMKALALARHGPGHARAHGLAYAVGVMACFAAVALTLIALRAGGAQIGWGFQLQSPIVVAVLADTMFLLGLCMSGVFSVGGSVMGLGSGLAAKDGLAGSFFTGVLATLVATPCTAPFMGAAVGYALLQPWPFALAVFLALGLGMALPFVVLTFFDPLLKRLPRPGVWMERLKHALAFPLYGSAVWLVWVLAIQAGPDAVAAVLAGMVVLAFAAWFYGLGLQSRWRWAARGAVVAAIVAAAFALRGPVSAPRAGAATANAGPSAFSEAALAELRGAGRPVLVNMTAAWCITCLANEGTSLSRAGVKAAMARKNVAYLKGDWTNQDATISNVLRRFGRDGVPLYLFYRPGAAEPEILPQILTEKIVLDALAAAPDRS